METTTVAVSPMEEPDANRIGSAEEKFFLEEFKIFTGAIFDIDKRVAQVFGFTIAAAVSLFSWAAKLVIEDSSSPMPLAYISLVPNLILIPAFFYLVAQRRDLVGYGAYLRLLERRLKVKGFQTFLGSGPGSIRASRLGGGEGNDPIPYTFWALFILSGLLFGYGILERGGGLSHFLVLIVPSALLGVCHWRWHLLIPKMLPELTRKWFAREREGKAP